MSARKAGFSLVEVSLAVLVVGLGLLTVFGLFPFGLKANEDSIADTRAALFAEHVFSGMRANAAGVATWADWNASPFSAAQGELCAGLDVIPTGLVGAPEAVPFPPGQIEDWIQYRLEILDNPRAARLQVWDRKKGGGEQAQSEFYTEFFFSGM